MKKLSNVKVLTVCAMTLAMAVILGFLKIPVTPLIEIRFGSIPLAISASSFGPAIGAVLGAASDILGFIAKPTGTFFPGFTISAACSGLLFGLILYSQKGKVTPVRIIIAEIVHTVVIGIFFNSFNLSLLMHKGFGVVVAQRLVKEIVMCPINCIIMIAILIPVHQFATKMLKEA